MNSTALAAIVVTICIICPLGFGFIWPAGESTEIGYTTEGNTDITQGLNNDTEPVEYAYTSYLNNMFYWNQPEGYDGLWYAMNLDVTTVQNSYPALDSSPTVVNETYYGDPVNLMSRNYAMIQVDSLNGAIFSVGGQTIEHLILFPGAGVGYAMKGSGETYNLIQVPDGLFKVERVTPGDTMKLTQWPQLKNADNEDLYIDTRAGYMFDDSTYWMNGEVNSRASLIMAPYNLSFSITADTLWGVHDGATVYIDATNNGNIKASVDGLEWKNVGSSSVYEKIMVEFNATDDTVTVTGLMNMPDYSGYTPSKRGNSVSFDVDFEPFKNIKFGDNFEMYGLVYMTSILTDPVAVMNDSTVAFADYFPDQQLAMNVKNVTQYGDGITFTMTRNGTPESDTLSVLDGYLTHVPFFGEGGTVYEDVSLRNLVIALIPNSNGESSQLMINGKLVDLGTYHGTLLPTDGFSVKFDGIWKAAVSVQDVVPYEYSSYSWEAGNFGMSASGFCTIGMMVAVLCTVASSLYARSTGMSAIIPLIASLGCAGVYLTMLFSL